MPGRKTHLNASLVAEEASHWILGLAKALVVTKHKPVLRKYQLFASFRQLAVSSHGGKTSV